MLVDFRCTLSGAVECSCSYTELAIWDYVPLLTLGPAERSSSNMACLDEPTGSLASVCHGGSGCPAGFASVSVLSTALYAWKQTTDQLTSSGHTGMIFEMGVQHEVMYIGFQYRLTA